MALYIGSYLLIVLAAGYVLLSGLSGRAPILLLSLLAGLSAGFIAVQGLDYSLAGASIAGLIMALFILSFLIWRQGALLSVQAFLAAAAAAEAGIGIGIRFYLSTWLVFVADLVFVALLFVLQRTAESRSDTNAGQSSDKTMRTRKAAPRGNSRKTGSNQAGYAGVIVLAAVAIIGGFLLMKTDAASIGRIGQKDTALAVYDETNDLQTARVEVNGAGFSPRNIEFRADTMIKLVFVVSGTSPEGMSFVSQDLDLEAPLHQGDNIFLVRNPKPGIYAFTAGGNGQSGTFTVIAKDSGVQATESNGSAS